MTYRATTKLIYADTYSAVIDMQLRYMIVPMALDIEHHTKLQLLRKVEDHSEDGYQIEQDYIDSLSANQKTIFDSEIDRNRGISHLTIVHLYISKDPSSNFQIMVSYCFVRHSIRNQL